MSTTRIINSRYGTFIAASLQVRRLIVLGCLFLSAFAARADFPVTLTIDPADGTKVEISGGGLAKSIVASTREDIQLVAGAQYRAQITANPPYVALGCYTFLITPLGNDPNDFTFSLTSSQHGYLVSRSSTWDSTRSRTRTFTLPFDGGSSQLAANTYYGVVPPPGKFDVLDAGAVRIPHGARFTGITEYEVCGTIVLWSTRNLPTNPDKVVLNLKRAAFTSGSRGNIWLAYATSIGSTAIGNGTTGDLNKAPTYTRINVASADSGDWFRGDISAAWPGWQKNPPIKALLIGPGEQDMTETFFGPDSADEANRATLTFTVTEAAAEKPAETTPAPATFKITAPPGDVTLVAGSSGSLEIRATGESLSYSWAKGNVIIAGATSAKLTFTDVSESDAGTYTVTVTDKTGAQLRASAKLTVSTPMAKPIITSDLADNGASVGSPFTLSAVATGSGPIEYWVVLDGKTVQSAREVNSGDIARYDVKFATTTDAGDYYFVFENEGGDSQTRTATVAITSGGTISGGTISGGTISGSTTSGGTTSGSTGATMPAPGGQPAAQESIAVNTPIAGVIGDSFAITGTVTDSGTTAANVTVTASVAGAAFGTSTTAADGSFTINGTVPLVLLPGPTNYILTTAKTTTTGSLTLFPTGGTVFTVTSAQRPKVDFNPVIDAAIENEMIAERNSQILIKAINDSLRQAFLHDPSGAAILGMGAICVVAAIPSEGATLDTPLCQFALSKTASTAVQAVAMGVVDGELAQHGVSGDTRRAVMHALSGATGVVGLTTGGDISTAELTTDGISGMTELVGIWQESQGYAEALLRNPTTGERMMLVGRPLITLDDLSGFASAGTNEGSAIIGIVLNRPARVIVSVQGQSLANVPGILGIFNMVHKTSLAVYNNSSTMIATVDGTVGGDRTDFFGPGALYSGTPLLDGESAWSGIVDSGANTFVAQGEDLAPGSALLNMWLPTGTPLTNASVRSYISPNGIATTGAIFVGAGTLHLLVRAVGPTLRTFGVTEAASDTALRVYKINPTSVVAEATDITPAAASAAPTVGAYNLTDGDSALTTDLTEGTYTFVTTSKSGGVVINELFATGISPPAK